MNLTPRHRVSVAMTAVVALCLMTATGLSAVLGFDDVVGTSITMLRNDVIEVLNWAIWGAVFAPWLIAAAALFQRRWITSIVAFVAPGLGVVAVVVMGLLVNPAPWRVVDSATVAGTTYHFAESSFLQGDLMAIVQQTSQTAFVVHTKRVVLTNGDSPAMSAKVLRPAGNDGMHLLVSADQAMVVGVRYDNCAFLAYDITSKVPWGHAGMFEENRAINEMSPFVLMGPDDEAMPGDAQRLFSNSEGCPNSDVSLLSDDLLRAATTHPNATVRSTAKRLLELRAGRD